MNGRSVGLAVLAFALTMCASAPPRAPRLEDLTLDEKIGQLFVVGAYGTFSNESGPRYAHLLHHVRDNHVGGVIWWTFSNVSETAFLARELQRQSRVPLFFSADLESGIGMRFADTTFWPWAMAVAATGDPSLAEAQGRITAMEAKAVGINFIYAPVADVNVDPDNPVINTRSYGEDPREVSKYVAAFIRGVQSQGVLACAKHFPGHGDTHTDSHRTLPLLDVKRDRLEKVEWVPFRAAIDAGVASVMMGHLAVPALDPTPVPLRADVPPNERAYGTKPGEAIENGTMPATLSRPMIEGVLRHDLGYRGLVVTDAMDMGGLTEHFDAGEAAIRAIEAGEDQVLMSSNPDKAIAAVKEAVRGGRLSEARIDESVRRILAAKATVTHDALTSDGLFLAVDAKEHQQVAEEIARRAVTLVRAKPGLLPLTKGVPRVLLVTVSDFPEVANPLPDLDRELRSRDRSTQTFWIDSRTRDDELPPIVAAAQTADVIVLGLAVRARSGAGLIAMPPAARTLVGQLTATAKPVISLSFGTPYLIRELPSPETYLCAYGVQPIMQVAVVKALYGEAPMSGKLPVTVR